MCKVYEFPKQLELPEEEAELLKLLGEAYVKALYTSLAQLTMDDPSRERMGEVYALTNKAFLTGMNKAIKELEEKS